MTLTAAETLLHVAKSQKLKFFMNQSTVGYVIGANFGKILVGFAT